MFELTQNGSILNIYKWCTDSEESTTLITCVKFIPVKFMVFSFLWQCVQRDSVSARERRVLSEPS